MNHYTYLIQYEDGKLYHGVRSCECPVGEDGYVGSSKHTPNDTVVAKHIVTTHDSRGEALKEEVWYHKEYDVKSNFDYYNRSNQTSDRFEFDWSGINHKDSSKTKISKSLTGKKHSVEHILNNSKAQSYYVGDKRTEAQLRGDKEQAKNISGTNHHRFGKPILDAKWNQTCEHCGRTMDKGNYTQHHGDNCKLKETRNG